MDTLQELLEMAAAMEAEFEEAEGEARQEFESQREEIKVGPNRTPNNGLLDTCSAPALKLVVRRCRLLKTKSSAFAVKDVRVLWTTTLGNLPRLVDFCNVVALLRNGVTLRKQDSVEADCHLLAYVAAAKGERCSGDLSWVFS